MDMVGGGGSGEANTLMAKFIRTFSSPNCHQRVTSLFHLDCHYFNNINKI